jgi:RimJ/RimL family protein N-acetyltransferase
MKFKYFINETYLHFIEEHDIDTNIARFPYGVIHYSIKHKLGNPVYELHMGVDEKHRGNGYAAEMIKSFLSKKHGIGYIAISHIVSKAANRAIKKIALDKRWELEKSQEGYIIRGKS